MDESETDRPNSVLQDTVNRDVLALLPREYKKVRPVRMYVQITKHEGSWVIAGFRDGAGALQSCDGIYNALFIYPISIEYDTGHSFRTSPIIDIIRTDLEAMFKHVSPMIWDPELEENVAFYVSGARND